MTTIRPPFAAPAAALCLVLAAAGAQASDMTALQDPVVREEGRFTWAPGYSHDDGHYVRFVTAPATGPAAPQVQWERRDTWRPGFERDDGGYVRGAVEPPMPRHAVIAHFERRPAPGALYEGQGEWLHTD